MEGATLDRTGLDALWMKGASKTTSALAKEVGEFLAQPGPNWRRGCVRSGTPKW